ELGLKEEEAHNLKQEFLERYNIAFKKEKPNWNEQIQRQRTRIQGLKNYQEFKKADTAFKQAVPLHKELQEILKQGWLKKEEIEKHYKGEDLMGDVRQYENAWQELEQHLKTIDGRLLELDKKKEEENKRLEALTDKIKPKLQNKGFEDLKLALKALMPADQYKALKQEYDQYDKEISRLNVELKTRGGQLQDLKNRFTSDENEKELKHKKAKLEEKSAVLDQKK